VWAEKKEIAGDIFVHDNCIQGSLNQARWSANNSPEVCAAFAMGVRLLAFTAAAGASDAVLARLDALGAEKRAGRWRTHAVYLHPRNEAHGLR